jgi:DNA-binding CsgD family transcriptional regulator
MSHHRDGMSADQLLERALALARETGDIASAASILAVLGEGVFRQGDHERARVLWEAAAALFRDQPENPWTAFAPKNLGYLALLAGDFERATNLLTEALAIAQRVDHAWGVAEAQALLAELARQRGDVRRAGELFLESLSIFAEHGDQIGISQCLTGIGRVLAMQHQLDDAVRLFGAAAAIHDALGSRQMHGADARDEAVLVPVRAALGGEAFDQAWATGRELSAEQAVVVARAVVSDELMTLRAASPRHPPHSSTGLTPRELEVLRLLVEGHSDKEIAAALFIGTRTVQTHVANLFTKLGVNARAEAAAVAVRRGIV